MGDVIEVLTTATNTVEVEAAGPQGTPGVGVPTGGSALQVLRKKTGTDYDTEWATGGGGASYDQSLNTTDSVTFESVTADKVAFDLTAAETAAQGELAWNADEETLDLGLAHGSVLQVGQETLYHVENSTASTITAGTLCVFSGTVGNSGKLRVAPHANNTNPTTIIGIATSTIAAGVGEEGYVTHFGKCRGINASGGAEAWANGDLLYASPTGGLTKTKPSAPIVTVAAVVSNNSSSGTLFVRPSFGQTAADVGAQGAMLIDPTVILGETTLTAARAKQYRCVSSGTPYAITLPVADNQEGDLIVVSCVGFNGTITVGGVTSLNGTGHQVSFRYNSGTWQILSVDYHFHPVNQINGLGTAATAATTDFAAASHTHAASAITSGTLTHERGGLEADVSAYNGFVKIASGSTSAVTVTSAGEALLDDADAAAQRTTLGLGTAATSATGDFAAASHSHGNINSSGQVGSASGLPLVTTTAGAVTTLALGTAGQILRTKSDLSGVEFADPAASGVTGAAASASDVLGVSGANITGVDANADRIVYWNNTSNKLAYGTPADAGAAAASHTHAASDITSGLAASATTDTTNASNISSGTLGTARLGTGTANSGTFLRGDQTWAAAGGVTSGSVDNAILRANGTGGSTSQGSDLVIDDATTSTQNNVAIVNAHSETNSSLVLTPKGTGAFILGPRPTGAASTGNARGANAVDLQTVRGAAARVASGQESVICGGAQNTASGTHSVVLGGSSNTASGERSAVLGGTGNTAGHLQTFVCGQSNSTGATYNSIYGGFSNNCAAGSYMSFIAGQANTTSAKVTVALGEHALADRQGTFAWGGGRFAANGDAQFVRAILRRKVSTAVATELLTDVDTTTGRFSIASGKTVAALIHVVAATSGGEFACQYVRECVIRNRGGTTALRGSVQTVGTDTEDFAACDVTISADDTNDALKIEFTGTAPVTGCTGTASTDKINKVAHGFNNNDDIIFSSLTGGAGLTLNTVNYWVINANADDFQVSTTRGGAAVNITTDYSDMTATRLFRVVALVDAVEVGHGT